MFASSKITLAFAAVFLGQVALTSTDASFTYRVRTMVITPSGALQNITDFNEQAVNDYMFGHAQPNITSSHIADTMPVTMLCVLPVSISTDVNISAVTQFVGDAQNTVLAVEAATSLSISEDDVFEMHCAGRECSGRGICKESTGVCECEQPFYGYQCQNAGTFKPTVQPTRAPTLAPTKAPTRVPTAAPTTRTPTVAPTLPAPEPLATTVAKMPTAFNTQINTDAGADNTRTQLAANMKKNFGSQQDLIQVRVDMSQNQPTDTSYPRALNDTELADLQESILSLQCSPSDIVSGKCKIALTSQTRRMLSSSYSFESTITTSSGAVTNLTQFNQSQLESTVSFSEPMESFAPGEMTPSITYVILPVDVTDPINVTSVDAVMSNTSNTENAIAETTQLEPTETISDPCAGRTCSGQGICTSGNCVCSTGFYGFQCQYLETAAPTTAAPTAAPTPIPAEPIGSTFAELDPADINAQGTTAGTAEALLNKLAEDYAAVGIPSSLNTSFEAIGSYVSVVNNTIELSAALGSSESASLVSSLTDTMCPTPEMVDAGYCTSTLTEQSSGRRALSTGVVYLLNTQVILLAGDGAFASITAVLTNETVNDALGSSGIVSLGVTPSDPFTGLALSIVPLSATQTVTAAELTALLNNLYNATLITDTVEAATSPSLTPSAIVNEKCAQRTCSGHGTCNAGTGVCECTSAYTGQQCSIPATAGPTSAPTSSPTNAPNSGSKFVGSLLFVAVVALQNFF